MNDPFWIVKPPYIFAIIGAIFFLAAAVFVYTGRAWVRFEGWVYRAKEPKWFWWEVLLYCLGGVFFIFIYLISVFP